LVEIAHPDFPGERLIACFNLLLAEERARKRPDPLTAAEKQLEKIAAATKRKKRPLRGKQTSDCALARLSIVTRWASTFCYASKRTVFTTNGKRPTSSENKIWMESMSYAPASKRKQPDFILP
jgi:hypothetical protein